MDTQVIQGGANVIEQLTTLEYTFQFFLLVAMMGTMFLMVLMYQLIASRRRSDEIYQGVLSKTVEAYTETGKRLELSTQRVADYTQQFANASQSRDDMILRNLQDTMNAILAQSETQQKQYTLLEEQTKLMQSNDRALGKIATGVYQTQETASLAVTTIGNVETLITRYHAELSDMRQGIITTLSELQKSMDTRKTQTELRELAQIVVQVKEQTDQLIEKIGKIKHDTEPITPILDQPPLPLDPQS